MYFVFAIELNLLRPCFGLCRIVLAHILQQVTQPAPAWHPYTMVLARYYTAEVNQVQFDGRHVAPLPFSFLVVLILCPQPYRPYSVLSVLCCVQYYTHGEGWNLIQHLSDIFLTQNIAKCVYCIMYITLNKFLSQKVNTEH